MALGRRRVDTYHMPDQRRLRRSLRRAQRGIPEGYQTESESGVTKSSDSEGEHCPPKFQFIPGPAFPTASPEGEQDRVGKSSGGGAGPSRRVDPGALDPFGAFGGRAAFELIGA